MMKKILLLTILILLFGAAFAYEQPLATFGFTDLNNTASSTTLCKELAVTIPAEAAAEQGQGILSINANFAQDMNDSTYVSVSVNGGEEKKYWSDSFVCAQKCWARVFVPELKQGSAKINICAVLGGATKSVEVTQNSFLGIYDTPALTIKNSSPASIYLGSRAKMVISVTNSGTKASTIFVQFIHPDTRTKVPITSFDIVEGDSSATTTIAPNETRQFIYYIKPTVISSYNLPSAALFFKNIFGEEETILSSHPQMTVLEQKQIEVSIVSVSETNPRTFKAIIKNNLDSAFHGTITMAPQTEFATYTQSVTVLPNSEKEISFEAKPLTQGNYSFQATIRDANQIYSSNTIDVAVTQSGVPLQILVAIAGIIIGALIFGWIYFSKVK